MFLYEYLSDHAQKNPHNPLVIHDRRVTSYAEVEERSNWLASVLIDWGTLKGDRVALFMENSVEYIIAYFAAQKTGAILVALNSALVATEIARILRDASPKVIFFNAIGGPLLEKAAASLPSKPRLFDLAKSGQEPGKPAPLPPTGLSMEDCTAILYTSGTTGKPKGVMLSHRNISANAASIIEYLGLTDRDSCLTILPFNYSYGASLLTTHVRCGGTLVLDNRFLYPNLVLDTLRDEMVTGFAGVPSHYAILLRKSALRNYAFPNLRYATQAGGRLSPAMIDEFKAILPKVKFFVMYGQTEATARLTYLDPGRPALRPGSVGKAIPGVTLTLEKEDGRPAAQGETGEIVASGESVMMGYWRSPEATAEVLRNNKLHTGDLAEIDPEGNYYIIGRKSDMIKSGANRISPQEIEETVNGMEGISECAAVGVPDEILGEAIRLFAVPLEANRVQARDIQRWCREHLAPFKMPKEIFFIDRLPKTESGKIKRSELKEMAMPETVRTRSPV